MSCKGAKTVTSKSISCRSRCGSIAYPRKAYSICGGSTRSSCFFRTGGYGKGFGGGYGLSRGCGFGGGSHFGGGCGLGKGSGFGGRSGFSGGSVFGGGCGFVGRSGFSRGCDFLGVFSTGGGSGFGGGSSFGGGYGGFVGGEKATLQNLNDRLASYLETVHSLESANAILERKICEFYERKAAIPQRDYTPYLCEIKDLQNKIIIATTENANLLLQIDNSKLAADDFRAKYEHELVMRQYVEGDIANLRRLLDQTNMAKCELEMQLRSLEDELACMRKNHQEELCALRAQLTGTVNVEVDAAPQEDLKKVLQEIRAHYENIIQRHRREQEEWFNDQMAGLNIHMEKCTEDMAKYRSEITDLRTTLQSLEIELQSQISMVAALEKTLMETEASYSSMLACFQNQINMLEAELAQLRASIEQQGRDYAVLLNIKACLEQEIATYRCLLEKQDIK
ncbi:keratin, type I cytoskeletal 19-like [Labeo rohita]|nr:keratin, type I cytoskeletal 19-like [Labeo rohita]